MLHFAGRVPGIFWKKHVDLGSTRSSAPGGTLRLEVGRPSYERQKFQEQKWDPQGAF